MSDRNRGISDGSEPWQIEREGAEKPSPLDRPEFLLWHFVINSRQCGLNISTSSATWLLYARVLRKLLAELAELKGTKMPDTIDLGDSSAPLPTTIQVTGPPFPDDAAEAFNAGLQLMLRDMVRRGHLVPDMLELTSVVGFQLARQGGGYVAVLALAPVPAIATAQLERAEAFVRAVLVDDFKQNPTEDVIRRTALRVLRALPAST